MANLKTLTIDGTSTSIDAGDYVRYDSNGIYLPISTNYGSAIGSVPTGANTDITLFTIPKTGLYFMQLTAVYNANATGVRFAQIRFENGARNAGGLMCVSAASAGETNLSVSAFQPITQGDTIKARLYQTSGSVRTVKCHYSYAFIEE